MNNNKLHMIKKNNNNDNNNFGLFENNDNSK